MHLKREPNLPQWGFHEVKQLATAVHYLMFFQWVASPLVRWHHDYMIDGVQMLTYGIDTCRPLQTLISALPCQQWDHWVRTVTKLFRRPVAEMRESRRPATQLVNELFIVLKKVCNHFHAPALNFFIASRITAWALKYQLPPVFTPVGEGFSVRFRCVANKQRKEAEENIPLEDRVGSQWKNMCPSRFQRKPDEWLG